MYELTKHFPSGYSATLFVTTSESMARIRFEKSVSLLNKNEAIELKHYGARIEFKRLITA